MNPLRLLGDVADPQVVLIAAHCDDLAIGAGGLLLSLAAARPGLRVVAVVATGTPDRAAEERTALPALLAGAHLDLAVADLPDGRLPAVWERVKDLLEDLRRRTDPQLVLAPRTDDAHQDHALLGRLVPTAFRDHLTLHYEIPKWDGDLGRPNVYVPLTDDVAHRKWELLHEHYPSQRSRSWFDEQTLLGLARLRGVECHARFAEGFTTTKAVVLP